jgi:hypothetical protein
LSGQRVIEDPVEDVLRRPLRPVKKTFQLWLSLTRPG